MVTAESSTEISNINNKTLVDGVARAAAASKSTVTVGKKTSGYVSIGYTGAQMIPFDLAWNEYPIFVGQAAGAVGNITGFAYVDGDKNKINVTAGGLGYSGYVELYYIRIS